MLTIALAVLLAVLGAGAVLAYVRQANDRAVSGLKAETVLEAKTTIPAGTSLGQAQKQNLLSTVTVPEGSLSAQPVRTVTAGNRNLVLSAEVGSGQLLLQPMLVSAASVVANGGIVIPTGMVAVTVQVCLSQAVAGYVTAGSYVAVFDTYAPKNNIVGVQQTCDVSHQSEPVAGPGSMATRIVLTRAQVLAVGQSSASQPTSSGIAAASADGPAGQSNPPVLVTLAVSQADAERLILIDEVGLPYLALLSGASHTAFDSNMPQQLFRTP